MKEGIQHLIKTGIAKIKNDLNPVHPIIIEKQLKK